MPASPLSEEEAIRILRALHELSEQRRIVVIGGQAVALWYRQLSELGYLPRIRLSRLASKDIDFRGARHAAQIEANVRVMSSFWTTVICCNPEDLEAVA